MFTILIPLIDNIKNNVLIPINIIINKGIPKLYIINNYKNKTQTTYKILSLLKLAGILKFKQILIEFPEFPKDLIDLKKYTNILLNILKDLLDNKNNKNYLKKLNLKYYIKNTTYLKTKPSNQFYIDIELIKKYLIHNSNILFYNNKNKILEQFKQNNEYYTQQLKIIRQYKNEINYVILTALTEFNINNIKTLLKIQQPVLINNPQLLKHDLLNLSIPRTRIIYNINPRYLIDNINMLTIKNITNYLILPTCNCGKLLSHTACTCTRHQIYKHLNDILKLVNYARKIYLYNEYENKFIKTNKNKIQEIYRNLI